MYYKSNGYVNVMISFMEVTLRIGIFVIAIMLNK